MPGAVVIWVKNFLVPEALGPFLMPSPSPSPASAHSLLVCDGPLMTYVVAAMDACTAQEQHLLSERLLSVCMVHGQVARRRARMHASPSAHSRTLGVGEVDDVVVLEDVHLLDARDGVHPQALQRVL